MAGAKRRHNLIASTLLRHTLNAATRCQGCQVFSSDMRVYVETHTASIIPTSVFAAIPATGRSFPDTTVFHR